VNERNCRLEIEKYHIRRAQPLDADALVACIEQAYAQYTDRITDLPAVADGCDEDIKNNHVWVAVAGTNIIGCVVLIPNEGFLKLANIAVHPDHRGQGLGRKLMDFSERQAKNQGCAEMRLNTHAAMPENIQLYSHLGWRETGRDGNSVFMKKLL